MKNNIVYIVCALIVAGGMIIGASNISDVILRKSFDTSISYPSSYNDFEIMHIESLMTYLGIYPEVKYDNEMILSDDEIAEEIIGQYEDPYEVEMKRLTAEILDNITSGKWVGFPYVKINDTCYFHKDAVDEWFMEKGKEQLEIS